MASEAFQLARCLGFQTIIFVGQDLAFTGGQSHTSGIKGVLGKNEDYIHSRYLVQVEGINGEFLDTDFQMNFYRQWLEKKIELYENELRVIDATEGGAKIEGTTIMPLKEAVAQECKREINIHSDLEKIQPVFREEQRKYLYHKAEEIEDLKSDFKRQAEKGILLGEKLLEEMQTMDQNLLSGRLKEVVDQNEKIDEHSFSYWAEAYAKEEESDVWEDIFAKEDMEIEEMIGRNIRLLKSYQAGISLFEEDYNEVFKK